MKKIIKTFVLISFMVCNFIFSMMTFIDNDSDFAVYNEDMTYIEIRY